MLPAGPYIYSRVRPLLPLRVPTRHDSDILTRSHSAAPTLDKDETIQYIAILGMKAMVARKYSCFRILHSWFSLFYFYFLTVLITVVVKR